MVVVGVDASGGGGDKNKEAEQDYKQEQKFFRTEINQVEYYFSSKVGQFISRTWCLVVLVLSKVCLFDQLVLNVNYLSSKLYFYRLVLVINKIALDYVVGCNVVLYLV